MPLNIETNITKIKSYVVTSDIVELIGVINILADPRHHQFASEWVRNIKKKLSPSSMDLLSMISNLPFQGLEFFELILESRCFNDIEEFIDKIKLYENNYFIHILTGEQLEEEKVELLKKDKRELDKFLNEMPWAIRENMFIFEFIVHHTETFKTNLCKLFSEAYNEVFKAKLDELRNEYGSSIKEVQGKLNLKTPVEVAEELLCKKIEAGSRCISQYIFIPSYFIHPHYLLAFNNNSWLIVYDMRMNDKNLRTEEVETLSNALKVIGDKSRLELLRLLILQPSYGKLLANRLNLTTATISHHLEQLQNIGLINETRNKNIKHFSADIGEIEKLLNNLKDFLFNK